MGIYWKNVLNYHRSDEIDFQFNHFWNGKNVEFLNRLKGLVRKQRLFVIFKRAFTHGESK